MNLLPTTGKVFIRKEPTDMRWGIDRLFWEVKRSFGADPYAGSLFLFYSRTKNRVKILHWDRGGFVLYYKRLERGRFRIPVDGSVTQLDSVELSMLLSGIDVRAVKRPRLWSPAEPASPA
jgi:transposase